MARQKSRGERGSGSLTTHRSMRIAILVASLGAVLAACGSSSTTSAAGSTTTAASSGSKVVTIDGGAVLSGPAAIFSQETDGMQAYFDAINAQGGVNGYKIKFNVIDTAYDPARALIAARQLVSENPLAIVGGLGGTPVDSAGYSYLKSTGVPVIAPMAAAQTFPGVNSTNYYLEIPDYSQLSEQMVTFAAEKLHPKTIAIVYQDDQAGIPAMNGVKQQAAQSGIKYVGGIGFPDSATAYSTYAAALEQTHADAVIIWGPPGAVAAIQKASTSAGYNPKWILPWFVMGSSWLQLGGTPGSYFQSWMAPVLNSSGSGTGPVEQFVAAMTKYYPKVGTTGLAEQGYVGASLFVAGLQKATAGGKLPTRQSLIQGLNSLTDYSNGLISGVSYSSSHYGAGTAEFLQNVGTSFVPLGPATKLPPPVSGG